MDDFPQKPQLGQPGGANPNFGQPQQPQQPHYDPNQPQYPPPPPAQQPYDPNAYVHPAAQQGYEVYQDPYAPPEEEPPPGKPKRKVPVYLVIFCVVLVGGTVALWMFKDQIQVALGKKEAAKEQAATAAADEDDGAVMDNETGDYIAAEESDVPVEATEEWKRRFQEGKNQHGVFYVPIATALTEFGAPPEDAPLLEREDVNAVARAPKVAVLKNAGFEGTSTEEWRSNGNCSVSVSGDAAKNGSKSLLVSGRGGPSDYPSRDLSTTLKKDTLFRITTFVQLKDAAKADMKLVVIVNDGSGDNQQIVVKKSVSNEKFTQLSGDFSLAVDNPLSVKLALICSNDSTSFYVDDASAKPSL